jgi:60 kDa SS-A/Ro ribonucleoprotein
MQVNRSTPRHQVRTAGGSIAFPHLSPSLQLRRLVMSCLLWEDGFYFDGKTIAQAIEEFAGKVSPEELSKIAISARKDQHLRHVPLLLTAELAKRGGKIVADTLEQVILRADEISEFLSVYWRNGKTPIAKQVKLGLARAFGRFDAYQLGKYDRAREIRLRDVLFLIHAKPRDEQQAAIWKQLVEGTLPSPDTWEVALSAAGPEGDKRAEWTRLLTEKKLGYFALLRNLRNMAEAGVSDTLVREAILARGQGADKVLPFRYVAAARACPRHEPAIDAALCEAISALPILPGRTAVLVDVSGSMSDKLSAKSDLTRFDAAAALASLVHGDVRMFSFSNSIVEVPPRRGMAGVDALNRSQIHASTKLFDAIATLNERVDYDRLIVITDEQDTGGNVRTCPAPRAGARGYMVNVASTKNGVGYGPWTHIDGFSENVLRWITESEAAHDAG